MGRPYLREMIKNNRVLNREVKEQRDQVGRLKKQLELARAREKHDNELREHWQQQVHEMDRAVELRKQIYHQNQSKLRNEVSKKEEELTQLKSFLAKMIRKQGRSKSKFRSKFRKPIRKGAKKGA